MKIVNFLLTIVSYIFCARISNIFNENNKGQRVREFKDGIMYGGRKSAGKIIIIVFVQISFPEMQVPKYHEPGIVRTMLAIKSDRNYLFKETLSVGKSYLSSAESNLSIIRRAWPGS